MEEEEAHSKTREKKKKKISVGILSLELCTPWLRAGEKK